MNEISEQTLGQLQKLADQLKTNQDFMAWVLEQYKKQERFSENQLIEKIGANSLTYLRLALCKRPDTNSSDFGLKVRLIAQYTQLDLEKIVRILRQVDSLQALSQIPQETTEEQQKATFRSGLLAAARDKEEQPPSDSKDDPSTEDGSKGEDDVAGQ
jgi:hypothetical protein